MRQLPHDFRVALRGFIRTPGFALTAVAILAIGIGMAIAMTTIYDALLVERLPVANQERLVVPRPLDRGGVGVDPAAKDIPQLARDGRAFSGVAAVWHYGAPATGLIDGDRSASLAHAAVTSNFFDVLGTHPYIGRLLGADDGAAGATMVMVLSYRGWQRQFGGDPAVIGRRLLDPIFNQYITIVGVAPPGLDYPAGVDYWQVLPKISDATLVTTVARLAPGATMAAARNDFLQFMARVDRARGLRSSLVGADVRPLADEMLGGGRTIVNVLMAGVVLLLAITCINVGGLLLIRAIGRAREIAIRRAVGASAWAIVRQLVVESALLALAGGLLGLAIAAGALRVFSTMRIDGLPRLDALATHRLPVGVALGTTLVALALFGLLPAIVAARGSVAMTLRLDTRAGGSRRRTLLRQSLVAAQMALALTTLSGAGLLTRSLVRLEHQDLGYTADGLVVFYLSYPFDRYKESDMISRLGAPLIKDLESVPGVVSATPVLGPPFLGDNIFITKIATADQSDADANRNPFTPMEVGNADYFRTMGIPIVRGRGFLDSDDATAPKVAVVSQSLAERLWPGRDPIGQVVHQPGDTTNARWTVVGVAKDAHFRKLRESSPVVYEEWRQAFWNPYVAVRIRGAAPTVLASISRAVTAFDSHIHISDARTMNDRLAEPMAQPRLSAYVLGAFAAIALVLSTLGLYGVVTAAVRERTRELGVRMALGASPQRLRADVLRQAGAMIGGGGAAGVVAAIASSAVLRSQLFEISPMDPIALAGACAVLIVVGLLAALLPARRASRIDPAQALRAD